jgi:hypothetical protein
VIANIRKDYENLNMEQARELDEWMRMKTEELAAVAAKRDPIHDLEMGLQLENMEQLRDTQAINYKEIEALRCQNELMTQRLQAIEGHLEIERNQLNEHLERQNEEVAALTHNLDALLNDYNHINANKATLEYEMQVYKRLLDSQLDRCCGTPTPCTTYCTVSSPVPCGAPVATVTTVTTSQIEPPVTVVKKCTVENQTSVSSNAFGGKVQNKKEKKGSIGIGNSSTEGKFIVIENSGNNATQVDLSGWVVKRKVDSNTDIVYKIPAGIVIPPNKEIIVWAAPYRQYIDATTNYLIADFENWGIGINSVTRLLNVNGEEKSSFCQQLSFSNPSVAY